MAKEAEQLRDDYWAELGRVQAEYFAELDAADDADREAKLIVTGRAD